MKKLVVTCLVAMMGAGISSEGFARTAGDVVLRAGAAMVDPAGDGALDGALDVDSNTQLGIGVTYMVNDTVGVGVLGATPFKHDILVGGEKVGSTRHLPPTITLQYHPKLESPFQPYVGAGVNYTHFYNETSTLGALELDPSTGLALEAGVDYAIGKNVGLNAAVWNADIDTDATLDGKALDTVEIDPWVYMVGAYYEF